jgi:hypothetical protein
MLFAQQSAADSMQKTMQKGRPAVYIVINYSNSDGE